MRTSLRHALRALAVATALATAVPLAVPAHAEDVVPLAEDTVTFGLDTLYDAAKGCTPYVTTWSPTTMSATPFIRNSSTWYKIVGGGTAHLSCPASVKIVARVSDAAPEPWKLYVGEKSPTYTTSTRPTDTGYVNVPYVGPDAPVLRPAGQITVHVEVFRKLSTTRYAPVYFGCFEWTYVMQPAASLTVTDPTGVGFCKYDGAYAAQDFIDGLDPHLLGGGEMIEIGP